MNVVLYCQYVWGMGHLFRSLELARALGGHRVALVAGGQEVDLDLPGHVELVRLPALFMDEGFTTLIPGLAGRSVASLQQERREVLGALFDRIRPEIFIVELYPFGRTAFGFELEPLLAAIRRGAYGRVRTVCSIRDVLVEKRDPRAYEARVVDSLNRCFDLLLIHSDERLLPLDDTFSRLRDIRIPKVYTGFVAPRPDPAAGVQLRRDLNLQPGERLVVVSCGGGRAGHRLLNSVLAAGRQLQGRLRVRLQLFTGPFMTEEEYQQLQAMAGGGFVVQRFTPRFLDYLSAADLSISLAGYNTCMNLLVTGVPALVLPYTRQREQPLRLEKIRAFLPLEILGEDDLAPARLARAIERGLALERRSEPTPLDLNGAAGAARFLETWVAADMASGRNPACPAR